MSVIEMSRPSVEQVSSLNSTRSRNSNDSKSSASELLSVTDAAVSALSRTSNPKVMTYERDNDPLSVFRNGISLLSPTDSTSRPSDGGQRQISDCEHNVSGRLSDGSRSTTESEVLIRSTTKDINTKSCRDRSGLSDLSKCSTTSQASSAFMTGRAKHVKISSKKLKEIKSPFEDGGSELASGSMKQTRHASSADKQTNRHTNAARPGKMSSERTKKGRDDAQPGAETSNIGEVKTFPRQKLNASDELASNKETITSADSGYMTHNVKVIRETCLQQEINDKDDTPRDVSSIAEEVNTELQSSSPIDVFANDKEQQSSEMSASSEQPDIFTVRETLVTIRATDVERSDGSTSQSSTGKSENQELGDTRSTVRSLEKRFSKFHASHLKQGTLSAGHHEEHSLNSGQVQISKTALTEKEKQLKEAFCKRNPATHAVKKHVIPTVIQKELNPTTDPKAPADPSVSDAATTAAVAAASAVAATQPFLKAQQDLEMRIAQLMQQIATGQQLSQPGSNNNKVEELERQLNDLTQHRIQYLEDMQKQQLQWQAQFFGMSRTGGGRHVAPPSEYLKRYDGLEAKTGNRPFVKQVMSDEELGISHYRSNRNLGITQEKAKSVLDTPAPRSKPPTPTVLNESQRSEVRGHIKEQVTPDRKNKASGGLLAQILSQDGDTPQKNPYPETPQSTRLPAKRHDVVNQQTHDLVKELGDLRSEMKQVIANANQWTKNGSQNAARTSPAILDQTISMYDGPAPLDQYLNKIVPPLISPYPSLKPCEGNAPVISNFSDLREVLKKVSLSRQILESNIESILRNRQPTDTMSLLQTLSEDSSQSERLRIQKMVDKHIKAMNSNMEKEVLDELLKVEEAKKSTANFMIPERDTTAVSSVSKVKVAGTRNRLHTEARVDSWMKKRRDVMKASTSKTGEKENIPEKRQKRVDDKKAYNKTQILPQRRTQKEPYLHFRTASPKSLSPKIIGKPVETKGLLMSSVKSQVGDGSLPERAPVTHKTEQQVPPPLIPMAIPLGEPRKDGGLKTPVFFPSAPAGPVTSTPCDGNAPTNVGMIVMKDKHLEEEEAALRQQLKEKTMKKAVKLQKMTLPPVHVDSFQSSPLTPRSTGASSPRSKGTTEQKDNVHYYKVASDETAQSESDDTLTEDADSAAIDLPGFKVPPKTTYHGPAFPPQAHSMAGATSNVLANDIRRHDLLQQQAVDWVEQELMAKLISELYIKKQDTVPHTPQTMKSDREQGDEPDIESEISQISSHESFIAEGLGQDGFQLFVDAGQPVDDKLVNALLKEVLLEKVASIVGQKTSLDEENRQQSSVTQKPKQMPPTSTPRRRQIDSPIQIPTTPVPTPKPTPCHTPPPQLRGDTVTRVVTPERTPSPSVAEQPQPTAIQQQPVAVQPQPGAFQPQPVAVQPQPVAVQPQPVAFQPQPVAFQPQPVAFQPQPVAAMATRDGDTRQVVEESEESTDESEETRFKRIIEGLPLPQVQLVGESSVPPHHNVSTPNITPIPSPPPPAEIVPSPGVDRTPTPSLRTPSPQSEQPARENIPAPTVLQQHDVPASHDERTQTDNKPTKARTCSIAVQAEIPSETKTSPPASAPTSPPASPKLQQHLTSSSSSGESVESSSAISETVNERVSEGQWLITLHSEGEIADREINQDLYERIKQHLLAGGRPVRHLDPDVSQAEDTLLDTDDLDPEEENGEFPFSEGEFHPNVLNKHVNMVNIMAQLEQLSSRSVQKLDHPATAHMPGVNMSLGEINLSQRPTTASHQNQSHVSQQSTRQSSHTDNSKLSSASHELQQLDEISEETEQKPESPKVKTISVQPRTTKTGGSPFKGQIRPVTVTPGGREPSRHYKHGYGPGARQRSIHTSRSFSPEASLGATRTSDKLSETATSRTSLLNSSDLDTQTSDQINVEALLQSQDYLASTQTDLGSTAGDTELGQSGKQSYGLTRSEELRYQSIVMQQSPGSTSDMSLAPGLTKTLERSEEELAQDSRQSCDDNSDLQLIDDKNNKPSLAAQHSGPLQVSVTIPSVGEEDSQTQESYEDMSEISLV